MSAETNQARHEQLIDFLNKFEQYKGNLTKVKSELTSDKFHLIDVNDINQAVVVLTDVLNLSGGSVSGVNLYVLLQTYLRTPEYREKFNALAREAQSYSYEKNK